MENKEHPAHTDKTGNIFFPVAFVVMLIVFEAVFIWALKVS